MQPHGVMPQPHQLPVPQPHIPAPTPMGHVGTAMPPPPPPLGAQHPPPMGANNLPGVTHLPFAPRQQQTPPARAITPEAREEKRRRIVNMEAMQGNSEYHDVQVKWGRMIPRAIPATRYNERDGLAGRDPLEVKVHEVVHDGVQNFGIRFMANGDFYIVSKSYAASRSSSWSRQS